LFNFLSSLYILNINPLSYECITKNFSHSIGLLFTLLIVFFGCTEVFNLTKSHLSILVLISWAFGFLLQNILPMSMFWRVSPVFLMWLQCFRSYLYVLDPF
jgi:hypothetical protein